MARYSLFVLKVPLNTNQPEVIQYWGASIYDVHTDGGRGVKLKVDACGEGRGESKPL